MSSAAGVDQGSIATAKTATETGWIRQTTELDLAGLSRPDLLFLLDLAERSLSSSNTDDIRCLLADVSRKIPTDGVVARHRTGEAKPDALGHATFMNVSYPEDWLVEYKDSDYFLGYPVQYEWMHEKPDYLVWSQTRARVPSGQASTRGLDHAPEYGLHEGVTVGVHNPSSRQSSRFSFAGSGLSGERRYMTMLRYLAPYLHEVMCRVRVDRTAPEERGPLSSREREVLSWAMLGKTNWEISTILCISERTVKFHVQNVMKKLEASTRAHAVALALGQGLIAP